MDTYDIPVLFQVRAPSEAAAAEYLRDVLVYNEITQGTDGSEKVSDGYEIESWHMPNHKQVDGSDEPVRVVIKGARVDYSV